MATGYAYTKQFDSYGALNDFKGKDMETVENLTAFLLANTLEEYEGGDKQLIRLLPEIADKFPGTITCVQTYHGMENREKPYKHTFLDRVEDNGIHDEVPEYKSSLSWIVDINTVKAYWESMAREAEMLALIHGADIPTPLRDFLLARYMQGERIDHSDAKAGFPINKEGQYHIAHYQHAYTDENLYAIITPQGTVATRSTSYSIGD